MKVMSVRETAVQPGTLRNIVVDRISCPLMFRTRHYVLLIAAAALLYLIGNGRVSLWDRDEPRYAQTSRQMLQSGDWVVPRFLDKVRTAKPVFTYWCQAGAMAVLGSEGSPGVFAARLPSVVAMIIVLILLAVVLARECGRERAFWTVFIFATCGLTVWSAKACTTDALLLVGITVSQLCLYAILRGRATWPVVIILGVAVAQAGLTKGPVVLGVMAATLTLLALLRLIDRRHLLPLPSGEGRGEGMLSEESRLLPHVAPSPQPSPEGRGSRNHPALKGIVCTLIVAALVGPWLYLVHHRESQFLGTSVGNDVLTRIVKPLEGHRGPPGYHLALIFGTFFPWSLLLPMALVFAWKHRADPQIRFALAAVIGPWVMFEIVQTKLPHYMLPAFPPLAFLTADAVVRCLRGEHADLRRKVFTIGVVAISLVMVAIGIFVIALAWHFGESVIPAFAVFLIALLAAAAVSGSFLRHKPAQGLLAMGIGMAGVYAALFGLYLPRAEFLRTSIRVADILHREGATGDGDGVMLDYKEPSLAFYQGGSIREQRSMTLSHALLDSSPQWLVITNTVWDKTPPDVRERLQVVESVRGLAYADGGRVLDVMVIRQQPGR
jgi:4-amino-4-deoxy-L-arabinose transferase-like glycosyltransferase